MALDARARIALGTEAGRECSSPERYAPVPKAGSPECGKGEGGDGPTSRCKRTENWVKSLADRGATQREKRWTSDGSTEHQSAAVALDVRLEMCSGTPPISSGIGGGNTPLAGEAGRQVGTMWVPCPVHSFT
jgi:hypothetical protein